MKFNLPALVLFSLNDKGNSYKARCIKDRIFNGSYPSLKKLISKQKRIKK